MIVFACAHPSVDKLFEVERLTPGAIHRPSSFAQVAGGKGLNAARAAAVLGAEVRAVALTGGHAGGWIEDETRSCLSVADEETGGLTEFYEDGPPIEPRIWDAFEAEVEEALVDAAWIALSGSIPSGAPEDGYKGITSSARRSSVRVAVDARGVFLERALSAQPDVVKVNVKEAAQVLGSRTTNDDPVVVAKDLRGRAGGDGHASVVTLGADGVIAVDPGGAVLRGTLDVRGRYPVGSGDAFLGGLLAALDAGDPFESALASGLGAAAANADVPGACRLDAERARALGARARVETI